MNSPAITNTSLRWRVILPVLAGALLVGVLALPSRRRPPTVPEVDRSQLTLREGRLVGLGEAKPFTGVLTERYPNSGWKSRSPVSNGLLEGLSEGWFTNAMKQVEEHFQAGVSHGTRIKWHPNGKKLSEVLIVHGQLEGFFRRWHENGALAEEIPMKQGQADGVSRAYFPSGCLKAEARLREGKVLEHHYWNDGERPAPTLAQSGSSRVLEP